MISRRQFFRHAMAAGGLYGLERAYTAFTAAAAVDPDCPLRVFRVAPYGANVAWRIAWADQRPGDRIRAYAKAGGERWEWVVAAHPTPALATRDAYVIHTAWPHHRGETLSWPRLPEVLA